MTENPSHCDHLHLLISGPKKHGKLLKNIIIIKAVFLIEKSKENRLKINIF